MTDLRTILKQTFQTANTGFAAQKRSAKNQIQETVNNVGRQLQNKIPEIQTNTKKQVLENAKNLAVSTVRAPARYVRDKIDRGADKMKSTYFKIRRDWSGGKKTKKTKKQNPYTKKEKKKINGVTKVIYTKKNSKKLYVKSKGRMINLKKYKKR